MPRQDPRKSTAAVPNVSALEFFTNRRGAIQAFERYIDAPSPDALRVFVVFGVGGVGKTTLLQRLAAQLRQSGHPLPHARFSMENIADPTQAYRECLLRMRCDLEDAFHLRFPRFDLCWAVMAAREGGAPPPMIQTHDSLTIGLQCADYLLGVALGNSPMSALRSVVNHLGTKSPALKAWLHKVGGTEDVLRLRQMALDDDQALPEELIRRFAEDLATSLPASGGCRGVLFLDAYEALWSGREGGPSAQARALDTWVRRLAELCLGCGILLVIGGRDSLCWAEDDPSWLHDLDQHLLGGLSAADALAFLSKCSINSDESDGAPSALQSAILACAGAQSPSGCHTLHLALCAEIVLNRRAREGRDPDPCEFQGIQSGQSARTLASRFLKSLASLKMEMWVRELSLTPRFDENAALALDAERGHLNGRAGWEQLVRFSFVDPQDGGWYRIHSTMRAALAAMNASDSVVHAHEWFRAHWASRSEKALALFHQWAVQPGAAVEEWAQHHTAAIQSNSIREARGMLAEWTEVDLGETGRSFSGDLPWARAHATLGAALYRTPVTPRVTALTSAADHVRRALMVFTRELYPAEWASAHHVLGDILTDLPVGDRVANFREAIDEYVAALRERNRERQPEEWAATTLNLAMAEARLAAESELDGLHGAVDRIESVLEVYTRDTHPQQWARTHVLLGNSFHLLAQAEGAGALRSAVSHYLDALQVVSRSGEPYLWASTLCNLANTLLLLAPEEGPDRLKEAAASFEVALTVFTEPDYPDEWATATDDLADVLRDMPSTEGDRNLERALECYQAALRVRLEATDPGDWAETQLGLARALRLLAASTENASLLQQADDSLRAAMRGFLAAGRRSEAAEAADLIGGR